MSFASIDDWLTQVSIPFSLEASFDVSVDRLMLHLGEVTVLGFGEALHGGDEFLTLRNRLFQRLVEAHGFTAITLEIADARARLVNDYVAGRGPAAYEGIQDSGFSYGAGSYAGNRELVAWMKRYNADPAHAVKLSFYGSLPSEQGDAAENPHRALEPALAYLQSADAAMAAAFRQTVEPLLGAKDDWERPAAGFAKQIMARVMGDADAPLELSESDAAFGVSPRVQALRLAVDDLAFDLRVRQPELVAKSGRVAFEEAMHELAVARHLLALFAAMTRQEPLGALVSMRDAMAAEHLAYIAKREAPGKVFVHLHNAHLRRTKTSLPWYDFWPTGAHLDQLFGSRFAVIGSAVGTSEENFIGAPEAGSLEARLAARESDCFVPTWRGRRLAEGELAALPTRTGSTHPYVPYTPLFPQSLADLDALAFLRAATYTRGAAPPPG